MLPSLALDLAGQGISINAVSRRPTRTAVFDKLGVPAEVLERMSASAPLGRLGAPEDVAGAIALLLSSEAAYITGHDLVVAGGHDLALA